MLMRTNEREDPMKLNVVSRGGRADVSYHDTSAYEATHRGGLSILERGRPTATWSRVSPAILGDIDQYVNALARR
jgi:hypothetical protein